MAQVETATEVDGAERLDARRETEGSSARETGNGRTRFRRKTADARRQEERERHRAMGASEWNGKTDGGQEVAGSKGMPLGGRRADVGWTIDNRRMLEEMTANR